MLNNQIKQKILFSFAVFTVFIFGIIIIPAKANADIPGYVTPYNNPSFNNNQYYYPNTYYPPAPIYIYPTQTYPNMPGYVTPYNSPTPVVYSNTVNPNARATTPSKTLAKKKTTSTKNTNTDALNDFVASTIFGSDSFMPSGLVQWIFFAILILLLTILVRKVYGGSEKYYATPMKHD